MDPQRKPLGGPGQFLLQVAGMALGLLVFIASIILGAFVLAAVFGFALIIAVIVWIRIWWFRRQMERRMRSGDDEIIEAEYHIVHRRRDDRHD